MVAEVVVFRENMSVSFFFLVVVFSIDGSSDVEIYFFPWKISFFDSNLYYNYNYSIDMWIKILKFR